jgi:hypothetical protein
MVQPQWHLEGVNVALFDSSAFGKPDIKGTGKSVLQAQQAVSQTPITPSAGPAQAAALSTAVTQNQTQQLAANAQEGLAQKAEAGKTAISKLATKERADAVRRRGDAQRGALQARQVLSTMGRDVEQKLFQDRLDFDSDAMGLRFKNARQLADFKRMVAKDDEEYQNFALATQQKFAVKQKLLAAAAAKIEQTLEQDSKSRINRLSNEQRIRLAKAARDAKEKQRKEAARAKAVSIIFQGAGMAAGAVATAGSPMGAAAGASAGAAAGQLAGAGVNYALDEA